jgi:hypothetical protein
VPESKTEKYIKELKDRAKKSHVYKEYQLTGINIAEILSDEKHKALYIKLAKQKDNDMLLRLAKNINEKKGIKNKGAYFMYCLLKQNEKPNTDNR